MAIFATISSIGHSESARPPAIAVREFGDRYVPVTEPPFSLNSSDSVLQRGKDRRNEHEDADECRYSDQPAKNDVLASDPHANYGGAENSGQ